MAQETTPQEGQDDENAQTRPGRNGGRLKNGPGPGRPKGSVSITTLIRRELEKNNGKQGRLLAKALILQACKGNPRAIAEIMSRIDGPVPQELDLKNNGGSFEGPVIYLPDNGRDVKPPPGESA